MKAKVHKHTIRVRTYPGDIVCVTWRDACATHTPAEGVTAEEISTECLMQTVGFYIKEDNDYLVLGGERYLDMDESRYRDVTSIPLGMIKELHILSLKLK